MDVSTRSSTRSTTAPAGLRALLAEFFDYAGTFPPASLPLGRAIKHYAGYRSSEDAWMLGRFVCSVSHLPRLNDYVGVFEHGPPFRLTVLPSGGETAETFLDGLERDLQLVQQSLADHATRVRVEQLEARLPRALLSTDAVTVRRFLNALDQALDRSSRRELDLFLEIPLDENLRQTLPILTGAAAARNRDRDDPAAGRIGVKMRTGGTDAAAFPDTEHVALVVAACRSAGVPFKSTAGLHHPIRHYNETVRADMHGFLNLLTAAVLGFAHTLDERRVAEILADRDASHFRITEDGIAWTELKADPTVIERVRREVAVSIGSCSFREPVDDLRHLGLL